MPKTSALEGRVVGAVGISGNKKFRDKAIIAVLAHRPPTGFFRRKTTKYSPIGLIQDRRRIEAFYHERGYFSAEVTEVHVKRRGNEVAISFHMTEGPAARITSLEILGLEGLSTIPAKKILAGLKIAEGRRFEHERYLDAKVELRRELEQSGYAHAVVKGTVRVDRDKGTARIQINVDPGPLVTFGDTTISGANRIPKEAVANRVSWRRGELYDPRKIEDTQRRIRSLGSFTGVRVEIDRDGRPATANTTITVSEGTHREVKAGGGGAVDSARIVARLRADYTHRSFLHPLVTFKSELRPGYSVVPGNDEESQVLLDLRVGLERQDLFLPLLTGGTFVEVEIETYQAYSTTGPTVGVSFELPMFERTLHVATGWQISKLDIQPDDDTVAMALPLQGDYRLAFFEQSIALDLRDDKLNPQLGTLLELRFEEGHPYAGSRISYFRTTADARGYMPLGGRTVLAARLRAGWLRPSTEQDVPLTRRYYAGGSTSHRGFGFRRLSPSILDEDRNYVPIGGDATFLASLEARYRLTTLFTLPLTLGLFLDGGDVTEGFDDVALNNLHWAAGFGLRLTTPVGPIRLDFARRLNRTGLFSSDGTRNPNPGGTWAFHFSFGEAF